MKKSITLLALVGLISLVSFDLLPKASYLLRYNPEVGKTSKMIMDYEMIMSMDMMGQTMNIDQTMTMGSTMEVLENKGKESTVKMNYDYFTMDMNNPMIGNVSYDSRNEENEGLVAKVMDEAMAKMLTTELKIVTNQLGEVIRTEGDLSNSGQSATGLDMQSMLGMNSWPEKALKIGESWTTVFDQDDSPMKMDIKLSLIDVKQGKVYIDMESVVSVNEDYQSEGEDVLNMSGTQTGTFVYEEKTMWLLEANLIQDLDMETEQMGVSIPMKIKGDISMVVE